MDWHITDAQSLAIIDQQVDSHQLSPAEYEIVRRVIYSTADFDYCSLVRFSPESLVKGAAALAACTSIVVDVPMIQFGILPWVQTTFGNSVYCCSTAITRPQKRKTKAAWGLETLAKSHSEAIFVIGQEQTALSTLVELSQRKVIQPAIAIVTPPTFVEQDMKEWLKNSSIPHIYIDSPKGGATVATSILNSLVELTWKAYQLDSKLVVAS
jgi:precorrin-8X/cobalt-precorrin-8 methylmutase